MRHMGSLVARTGTRGRAGLTTCNWIRDAEPEQRIVCPKGGRRIGARHVRRGSRSASVDTSLRQSWLEELEDVNVEYLEMNEAECELEQNTLYAVQTQRNEKLNCFP